MRRLIEFRFLLFASSIIIVASCTPLQYYQVCKTQVDEEMRVSANRVVYEDDNCSVAYDLWTEGGNPGFWFRNNTDEDINLHLDRSYFVKNGVAYDYFLDRIFGATSQRSEAAAYSAMALTVMNTSGQAQNRKEKNVITIPAKTRKKISEYSVGWLRITDCDLPGFPTRLNIRTKVFDKENSPIVFSNRIAYSLGDKEEITSFENEFFVSEVTNYPEREMYETRSMSYCGNRVVSRRYMRYVSPDAYYLKYNSNKR
jgi:hypothetical protein